MDSVGYDQTWLRHGYIQLYRLILKGRTCSCLWQVKLFRRDEKRNGPFKYEYLKFYLSYQAILWHKLYLFIE